MKKVFLLFAFALIFGLLFPIVSSAATDISDNIVTPEDNLVILDDSFKFTFDSESGIFFPEKIVSVRTDENGMQVEETIPIDDFKISETEIIVDGITVAKISPKLQKDAENISMFSTGGVCGGYNEITTISRTIVEYNKFIRYHPDFSTWRQVSGYYFSNSSVSISVALGGTYGNLGVSYSPAGSGYFINTTSSSRGSRPYIQANIQKHYYKVTAKSCTGQTLSTSYKNSYQAVNTQIKIAYQ